MFCRLPPPGTTPAEGAVPVLCSSIPLDPSPRAMVETMPGGNSPQALGGATAAGHEISGRMAHKIVPPGRGRPSSKTSSAPRSK